MTFKNIIPWRWSKKNVPVKRVVESPIFPLHQEINRLFDDFNRGFDLSTFGLLDEQFGSFNPRLNVEDNGKEVRVTAELPGMNEKDINVSLMEGLLTIKGEKKNEREDKNGNYYRLERSYGSFHRTIPLPSGIDEGKTDASFKEGVLTITLPKTEEAQKEIKKIPVSTV